MIDYTDIDAKLEGYSEAFDFYMDQGEMPATMPPDDCLAEYMQEVIDNNPQIDGTDPMWVEVMKDDVIAFFGAILEQFRQMQIEAMNELALIDKFEMASIEEKREMWKEVKETIENGYSKFDVNLPGFMAQFKDGNLDAVFSALTGDWRNACESKLDKRERQMLERSRRSFERICRDAGSSDYEDRKRIDNYIHKFQQLQEIVDMIGRDKDRSKEEEDKVIYKFLPITVSKNPSVEEINRIESGNNLERVLPMELSMPEDLFYKRFVIKELQQFSSPGKDKPRKIEAHTPDPRLNKGPIIVSIDTSDSMNGRPQKIAFSLLKQLVRMAKKQKRPCYLISFSVRSKCIDLATPRNWGKLDNFLENSFSGGTDGESMLEDAIGVLQKGTYEMADVLIISDLQFTRPCNEMQKKIIHEQSLGTRFYALQIGSCPHEYNKILDKIWQV